MKQQPDIKRRSDGKWMVWEKRRDPEYVGVDLRTLKPWIYSTMHWELTGVYGTRLEALKAIGKAK